jgi:hypothetical protein
MDSAVGLFFGSIIFAAWILGIAWAIRNRIRIAEWLNASDMIDTQIPDRETILERRITKTQWDIDDAKAELENRALSEEKKQAL